VKKRLDRNNESPADATADRPSGLLGAALEYAGRGWPVIPLHAPEGDVCSCGDPGCQNVGKHPRTLHGVKDAIRDKATIRGWWKQWPKANIGIATGARSGIVVLDSDPRHDGDTSLRGLEQEHGLVPEGPRVRTGGNGTHFYLKHPGTMVRSRSGIAPGLDVRGDGGYVVAPPSRHASGKRYRWAKGARPGHVKLPTPPKWLQSLMGGQVAAPSARIGESIPEGERNATLTSLAGAMRRRGATEEAILAALQNENGQRCQPPLPDSEVQKIAASVSQYAPAEGEGSPKISQATKLVAALVGPDVRFFHTPEKEAYVTIGVGGHRETYRIRDMYIRRWLARCFYKRSGAAPASHVLNDVLGLLEALALFEGPEEEVFIRLAQRKRTIYIDLCNTSWQAIKITSKRWKVISNPRVNFRRARGMKPLPRPVRGRSINELRQFLNLATHTDFVLFVSWLVAALNARGPYPVLVLQGEAGSAKSTAARVLRELIDPNTTPLRAEPREVRDLMIAARNSWLTAFDNVTHLPPWLSDALCRLATGGGFGTRMLYTDDEEKLFEATRPVLMNGIDGTVTRGDLLDRSLIVYLPIISDEQRKPEKEFWRDFRNVQPRILGVLLDAVSCALRRLDSVKLEKLPRMADFAQWAVAAEPALGWPEGTFMRAYESNRQSANTLALEASPIVPALRRVCARYGWTGTATELLGALGRRAGNQNQQRYWPQSGWALSMQLRRIAPNLRAEGLDVRFGKKTAGERSRRIITIERIVDDEVDALLSEYEQAKEESNRIQRFPRLPSPGSPLRFPRG
jgi:hypothetical protein